MGKARICPVLGGGWSRDEDATTCRALLLGLRQAGRPWFAPLYGESRATLAAARPVGSSGLLEVLAKSTGAVPGLWVSLAAALGVLCQPTPQRAVAGKNKGGGEKGTSPRSSAFQAVIRLSLWAALSPVCWAAAVRPYGGGTLAPC